MSTDYAAVLARIDRRTGAAERTAPAVQARLSIVEFADRLRSAGRDPADVLRGATPAQAERVAAGRIERDGLCRTMPFTVTRAEGGDTGEVESDGLNITGYGAVFDSETEINSWEGHFVEKIRKGAFRKSLRESTPKMQFDHGHHPLLGGLPLGRWDEVREDDHGVFCSGRLYDNWLVQPFRDAIADPDGGVEGMSFRFSVVREKWTDVDGKEIKDDNELFELLYWGSGDRGPITRELIEVKAPEMGPVVWPAYKDTEVGARSADGGTLTIDLAAMRRDPRHLADVAALIDAETRRAQMSAVLGDVDSRIGDLGDDEPSPVVHTEPVHTGPPAGPERTETEPPATDRPAVEHPERTAPAPPDTGTSAGEHSSSANTDQRPANPRERSAVIKGDYRKYLDRTLALPES